MSKIGKLPITIPSGVTVEITGSEVKIIGPKGIRNRHIARGVEVKVENG